MEKKKKKDIRKENAGSKSQDVTSHCQLTYEILTFYLEQLLRNLLRKNTVLIAWREKKITNVRKNKQDKADYLSHTTTCHCYSVNQI